MSGNNDRQASGFRYPDVLRRGRPIHDQQDAFSARHPAMPLSRRAKIFSPFDALKGFSEALREKERQHIEQMDREECMNCEEHMDCEKHMGRKECMDREKHTGHADDME